MNQNPIIFYDGFCNLCSGVVGFIAKHNKKKIFRFVPLQSAEALGLLSNSVIVNNNLETVVLYAGNKIFLHSDAVIEIGKLLGFPFNLVSIFKIIPSGIRDNIYKFISSRRYKWFGKRTTCKMTN